MNVALIFVALSAAELGQLGDSYTTERGLAGGLKEGNPVASWIVSKIGVTGMTLLKVIGLAQAVPVLAYVLTGYNETYLTLVAGIVGVEGIVATVLNYLTMKKAGIKL
jgi:hypothetical protein